MSRQTVFLEKAANAAKRAREIAEKADSEGRELTADERVEYDGKFAEAVDLKAKADAAKADADLLAKAKAMAEDIGLLLPPDATKSGVIAADGGHIDSSGFVPLEKRIINSDVYKSLIKSHNGRIGDGVRVHTDPIHLKALISGVSGTSAGAFVTAEDSGIIDLLGRKPLTLRDLVSVRRTGSDAVEFVRQTSRVNAAAETAEATSANAIGSGDPAVTAVQAGVKPEGGFAFQRVTTNVVTIAEWVPVTKRALSDAAQLEGIIRDELVADLREREDAQLLNGNGSGENLTGILNTSGIQTQSFSTDIFESVRKALTKVRVGGRAVASGILISPADLETIDLARESATSNKFLGAGPFAAGQRTLWGVPLVENENLPSGKALVGDFKKAVLWDREQATVSFSDSHADFFTRNLVAALAEERIAFGVIRPAAFVEVATVSAG